MASGLSTMITAHPWLVGRHLSDATGAVAL
jgi:hypothetical protein